MKKRFLIALIAFIVFAISFGFYESSRDNKDVSKSEDTSDISSASSTLTNNTNNTKHMNETEMIAKNGDMVFVQYTGKLTDGTVFDSSIPRGQPFSFILGQGLVIQGWEKGLLGMKKGEKKTLTISPEDGYGARGVPNGQGGYVIPPNATLVFDVELVDIKR